MNGRLGRWAGPSSKAPAAAGLPSGQRLHDRREQRPERVPAVADGVLLLRDSVRRSCGPARWAAAPGRSRSRRPRAVRAAASPRAARTPRLPGPRSGAEPAEPGTASAAAQTNAAPRYPSGTSASWSSSSRRLAASSPCRPAQRAEKIPGAPPSTSTASPESSAIATSPVACATARALSSEFSAKVTPVSATSGAPTAPASTTWVSTSRPGTCPRSSSRSSRSLPWLCVASTSTGAGLRCAAASRAAPSVTGLPPGFRAGWRRAARCPSGRGRAAC